MSNLFEHSVDRSPFQYPSYLKFLSQNENCVFVEVFEDQELVIYGAFAKKGNRLKFLSNVSSDHDFFIVSNSISESSTVKYLGLLIQELSSKSNYKLMLEKIPEWWNPTFVEALKINTVNIVSMPYAVCPKVVASESASVFDIIENSKIRYFETRLRKQEGFNFLAQKGLEDISKWSENFAELHKKRWAKTSTPSIYENTSDVKKLAEKLTAYVEGGLLCRFSIELNGQPIAMCIGLLGKDRLIYHSIAHDISFEKFSPGKALIRLLAGWMKEQNISILDFGNGDEAYKYSFANGQDNLYRYYIDKSTLSPFLYKAKFESWLRQNDDLMAKVRKTRRKLTSMFK